MYLEHLTEQVASPIAADYRPAVEPLARAYRDNAEMILSHVKTILGRKEG